MKKTGSRDEKMLIFFRKFALFDKRKMTILVEKIV